MSDDFGEQLRNAANAAAARSERPPVTAVRRRLARRRATVGVSVAGLVALAVVAGAGALEARSALEPIASPTPTATAVPAPVESPAPSASPTTPPPPAEPPTIVAGRGNEAEPRPIVFLSAATGRVMRTLAVEQGDGPFTGPVVSYDRKTIYFWRNVSSCAREVVSVPADGGGETLLASGYEPAVSPDGHWLAYKKTPVDCSTSRVSLVVRNLRTGAERLWHARPGTDGDVLSMAWSPDSRHLAVIRHLPREPQDSEPGPLGDFDRDLWILDTRAPGTTVDTGRKVPNVHGLINRVTYRGPEGTLLVLSVPSHLDLPSALSEVDPDTGRVTERYRFPGAVYDYDFDASGHHLLFVWHDTLYRWVAGRDRHVDLAGNVTSADW